MTERKSRTAAIRRTVLAFGVALGVGLAAIPAVGVDRVDPDADKILRSMSTYLGSLSAFSVDADVDNEVIDLAGQKLQLSSSATIVVERPGKLYAHRRGPFGDAEIVFDGKTLTLSGKNGSVYARIESPGTIDDAIRTVRAETGLDAPGADLLYADPYPGLVTDLTSGAYLGTAYVHGVECHHLAFRAAKVDWQVWVQTGDAPLPMKYVITSKWVTGAPEYTIRLRDWNTHPQIEASRFEFSPPEGARKLETILANEIGELMLEGAQ